MSKLLELIKKDFKLLVRSKTSSSIIFLGPLLLVSLLGLAYSQSSDFTLTSSVYSSDYSELSESLISQLGENNFGVIRSKTIEDCISDVKLGNSQACLHFPDNMTIAEGRSNEITFYVDYSQVNLVWILLDAMSASVSEKSAEISKDLTQDLLNRMWFVESKIKGAETTLTKVRDANLALKDSSGSMKSGVAGLDISVDFSTIDIDGARAAANDIVPLLTDIQELIVNLYNETRIEINDMDDSLDELDTVANTSSVSQEVSDIESSVNEIEDLITDANLAMDHVHGNASIKITSVLDMIDQIDAKLAETKTKINSVKKSRDDLIPEFNSIEEKIDGILANLASVETGLDEALQKIEALKIKNSEGIVSPISTKIEPVAKEESHFNSLFPALLVLVIMITGILLASTLVIVEKKSKAFFRNHMTPTSFFTFSLGTYITGLIVVFIQILLFISVSAFFFETDVISAIGPLALLVLLISTVFICIGMFVGFIFKTEETVTLASITLASICLLFSSVVIPMESMPAYFKKIALFNPFVVSETALRQSVIHNFSIMKVLSSIGVLAAYAVVIFVLLIVLQKALKKLSFMHFNWHFGTEFHVHKKGTAQFTPRAEQKEEHKDINELAVNPDPIKKEEKK